MSNGFQSEAQERTYYSRIQRVDESIFLGLQVTGGQILLPLLVLTIIFSRNVHRNPVFINFCCSWIFSSIIYSLLVYRGRSDPGDLSLDPSAQECLVQASLINGVLPLTACTTIAIAIQLLSSLLSVKEDVVDDINDMKRRHLATYALLVFPYIVFLIFTVVSVVLGTPLAMDSAAGFTIPDSNLAVPDIFYCLILSNGGALAQELSIARAPLYFSLALSTLSLLLEAFALITVLRNLVVFRKILPTGWTHLLARIVVFSLYRVGVLSLMFNSPLITNPSELFLTGFSTNNLYNGIIDLMQATVPLAVFLVFASEKDILNAWCFWKKNSSPVPIVKSVGPATQLETTEAAARHEAERTETVSADSHGLSNADQTGLWTV